MSYINRSKQTAMLTLGLGLCVAVVLMSAQSTGRGDSPAAVARESTTASPTKPANIESANERPALRLAEVLAAAVDRDQLALNLQQQPAAAGEADNNFTQFASCVFCHYSGSNLAAPKGMVSLEESKNWLVHDKHARAFRSLQTERGQQMGQLLQKTLNWEDADVTTKFECLSCHVNAHEGVRLDPASLSLGVGCHSCHSTKSDWFALHTGLFPPNAGQAKWRDMSPTDKSAMGFIDVRHPVSRAEQCLNCHIGNASQGKVLTHEMYAAGHPPLPSIEVQTYLNQMPPHWQDVSQKSPEIQRALSVSPTQYDGAKNVLIGSVLALRQTVELLAHQMNPELRLKGSGWPDFAQFNCYDCHHELESPSWRQVRGYKYAPGRPQLPAWPTAILDRQVLEVINDPELLGQWQEAKNSYMELTAALSRSPFGRPDVVGDISQDDSLSGKLVQSLTQVAQSIEKHNLTENEVLAIAHRLSPPADLPYPDYESARQIAWAMQAVVKDLKPANANQIAEQFTSLNNVVALQLPKAPEWTIDEEAARAQFANLPELKMPPSGIEQALPESMRQLSGYQPASFRALLRGIAGQLPPAPGVPDPAEIRPVPDPREIRPRAGTTGQLLPPSSSR